MSKRKLEDDDYQLPTKKVSDVTLKLLDNMKRNKKTLSLRELKIIKKKKLQREYNRKVNNRFFYKTVFQRSLYSIDRTQRVKAENDDLQNNLPRLIGQVKALKMKFLAKLVKRESEILKGNVDPEEPEAKESTRQMIHWLSTVPLLLSIYDKTHIIEEEDEREMSTVFNYAPLGNNTPMEKLLGTGSDNLKHDESEDDEEDEITEDSSSEYDSEEDYIMTDSDDDDQETSDSEADE